MALNSPLAPSQTTVWPEQWYLEIARSALSVLDGEDIWKNMQTADYNTLANIGYAWKSVVVINSTLAIEAFCNNKLFRIWQRGSTCEEGKRFIQIFGEIKDFAKLRDDRKNGKKVRELTERVKTLFNIMGFQPVSIKDLGLWQNFCKLVKDSRHFLVHPFPDDKKLDECLNLLKNQDCNLYSDTAAEIIRYFYEHRSQSIPKWLDGNVLFDIRTVEYLGGKVKHQDIR